MINVYIYLEMSGDVVDIFIIPTGCDKLQPQLPLF